MEVINGEDVLVNLWDTGGQQNYQTIIKSQLRQADSFILMFDLTDKQSFLNIKQWVSTIRQVLGDEPITAVLVGNKADKATREVYENDVDQLCEELDVNNNNYWRHNLFVPLSYAHALVTTVRDTVT